MFTSIRRTGQALAEQGVDVNVIGLSDGDTSADLPAWAPLKPVICDSWPPRAFGYAPELYGRLSKVNPDLVHVQGLWMYPSLANLHWSSRMARPYLISPRGMLDPWALQNSRWKKQIVRWSFENRHLSRASCLHALCQSEHRSLRAIGLSNPICVIPNGVDLDDEPSASVPDSVANLSRNRRVLAFVGRIHPKKGLPELISAWTKVRRANPRLADEWSVLIAGWDQGGHAAVLERQIRAAGLESDVHLIGPHYGEEKTALLRSASGFVLPSKSEGLPMAVLEAWAQRLPVAITLECNLPEAFSHQAAVELEPGVDGIARGLSNLLTMPDGERSAMGQRGRTLVEKQFSWQSIAAQMHSTYCWLLGGGAPPDFVERN